MVVPSNIQYRFETIAVQADHVKNMKVSESEVQTERSTSDIADVIAARERCQTTAKCSELVSFYALTAAKDPLFCGDAADLT